MTFTWKSWDSRHQVFTGFYADNYPYTSHTSRGTLGWLKVVKSPIMLGRRLSFTNITRITYTVVSFFFPFKKHECDLSDPSDVCDVCDACEINKKISIT